jgi:hypothetical protein
VYRFDGTTHISAIDAERMLSIVGNGDLAPIAAQVRDKLSTVVERAAASRPRRGRDRSIRSRSFAPDG